jgi:hypothetical protein
MSIAIIWQTASVSEWADAPAFDRATRLTLVILSGIAIHGLALLLGGLRRRQLEKGAH